jgi:hypothetical protein
MIILTMLASEGAPDRAEGKDKGARVEMIQRFLLNRIDSNRRARCINKAIQLPVLVLPYTTDTMLLRSDGAMMRAEETLNGLVLHWFPKHRLFFHQRIFNEPGFINVLIK